MGARVALTLVLAVAAAACGLDFDHFNPPDSSRGPADAAPETTNEDAGVDSEANEAGDAMLPDVTEGGPEGGAGDTGADVNPPPCGAIGQPCCTGGVCNMGSCNMQTNKCHP